MITIQRVFALIKERALLAGFSVAPKRELRRQRGQFVEGLKIMGNPRSYPEGGVTFSIIFFAEYCFRASPIDASVPAGSSCQHCEIYPNLGRFCDKPGGKSWMASTDEELSSAVNECWTLIADRALVFFAQFDNPSYALDTIRNNPYDVRLDPMRPEVMIRDLEKFVQATPEV